MLLIAGVLMVVAMHYAVKGAPGRRVANEVKYIAVQHILEKGPDKYPGEVNANPSNKLVDGAKTLVEEKCQRQRTSIREEGGQRTTFVKKFKKRMFKNLPFSGFWLGFHMEV